MTDKNEKCLKMAAFRFSLIGRLVSDPPEYGELRKRIAELAAKSWRHPITGEAVVYSIASFERWYYRLLAHSGNPIEILRNKDRGFSETKSISSAMKGKIREQYLSHRRWSFQLHYDNIKELASQQEDLGKIPSYSTFCRYMKMKGFWPQRGRGSQPLTEGQIQALERFETREVRSYEALKVGALFHLDFHHSSRRILTKEGILATPILLIIMDDHSRLCCHAQWYFSEDTKVLVHGFIQALMKRGLCWALMSDNGSAMISEEFTQGLTALGIFQETTLPYSPYQNGKQERMWGLVEGRLLKMLENVKDLDLKGLNDATQAWIEMEYNNTIHSETNEAPRTRFMSSLSQLRPCPDYQTLCEAFRIHAVRKQRLTDGTISIASVRFEVPDRLRHLRKISVRYARWDLSLVDMVDERSGKKIERLYPLDKSANASKIRRLREDPLVSKATTDNPESHEKNEMAPLLKKYLEDYSSLGILPAYLYTSEKGDN